MNIRYYALALGIVTSFSLHTAAGGDQQDGYTTPPPREKANNAQAIQNVTADQFAALFAEIVAKNSAIPAASPARKFVLRTERAALMKEAQIIASHTQKLKWLNALEKFPRN